MNFLINKYPTTVEIDNIEYPINCDFRTCLKIMICFEDKELNNYEKIEVAMRLFYPKIPDNLSEANNKMFDFLNLGKESTEESSGSSERLYSFKKDSFYIMSGIQKTHRINLEIEDMHWWKFVSLFMEMSEDTFISQLIYLRKQYNKGKLTESEKEMYYSLGDIVEIEQDLGLDLEEQRKLDRFYDLLERNE